MTVASARPSNKRSEIDASPPLALSRKRSSGASPSAVTTMSTTPLTSADGVSSPGARRKIAPTLTSSPERGELHVQS
jgi:hypothetical protein